MTTEFAIKKTFGWIFLAFSIVLIAFTIIKTANYFTGVGTFPELFFESNEVVKSETSDSLNDIMQSMLSDQLNSFISKESIILLLNMTAWSLFAFFMVFSGAKIFELGLKLMKE